MGSTGGAGLAHRHSLRAAHEARRSVLAVAAQATVVEPFTLPIGLGAQLRVEVTNLGPLPVRVVTTDRSRSDTDQGTVRPLITMLDGDTSIAPGTQAVVQMRLPVDCRPGRLISTSLLVRTVDGTRRTVPVSLPDDGRPAVAVCPQVSDAKLQATLTGTPGLASLQLANLSGLPLRVSLPPQGLTPGAGSGITVVTKPVLPTTIRPHDRLGVRLELVVSRCVSELSDLQRRKVAGLVVTASELTARGMVDTEQATVNVTAVVAAAMVRTCG